MSLKSATSGLRNARPRPSPPPSPSPSPSPVAGVETTGEVEAELLDSAAAPELPTPVKPVPTKRKRTTMDSSLLLVKDVATAEAEMAAGTTAVPKVARKGRTRSALVKRSNLRERKFCLLLK